MAGRHRKPPSRHHRGRHRQPTSNARWVAPTLATLAVLAAGGVSAYSALHGTDSSPAQRPAPVSSTGSPTPAPATSTAPTASPTPTPDGDPAAAGHQGPGRPARALTLVVTGRVSWVEVTRDNGHTAFSGLLRHGHRLVYRQGPVHVVVGNAGAVRAGRHGHRPSRLGRPGQVVRFTVR